MVFLKINSLNFRLKEFVSIIEACKTVGIIIPRFCYHETLSISGNCRMCLVEIEGIEKPVASCLTEISDGLSIYTDSLFVKKARENVVETLLLNHPLDCPICDQAGECDLQDQAKTFGNDYSRFFFNKRGVEDKDCGPLIKTIMTRCIHCTRCVRFGSEVAGIDFLGTLNRGTSTEIGSYVSKFFDSEISGNVIDLCPVGALTSKPYGFQARPWELRVGETIDITDSTGANIYVNFKEADIYRILPKSNKNLNENIITDKARFSYDANRKNRVKNLFNFKFTVQKFRTINWTTYFKEMDVLFTQKNASFKIVINDDIGFENMQLLKKSVELYKNIIICSLQSTINNTNSYIYGLTDKINSINECNTLGFLFSVNPKLECSIINTRLRTKFRNTMLTLITLNLAFNYNIPGKFVNLNVEKSLKIFEGLYSNLSKKCVKSESPLMIISDLFKNKGLNISEMVWLLKSYFETIKIIKINLGSNSESLNVLNIKNNIKRNTNNEKNIFCLNLDDTFSLRKNFFSIKEKIVWFNTHGSDFATKVNKIVPIFSEFEDDRILLNLEQRPQKITQIFNSFGDCRSLKNLLLSLFFKSGIVPVTKSSSFIEELASSSGMFDNMTKKYISLFNSSKHTMSLNYLTKYPTKANLEDFYLSNKTTKNSPTMMESSQYLRKLSSNFMNITK